MINNRLKVLIVLSLLLHKLILSALQLLLTPLPDLHEQEAELALKAAYIGSLDILDDCMHDVDQLDPELLVSVVLPSIRQGVTYRNNLLREQFNDELRVFVVVAGELAEVGADPVRVLSRIQLRSEETLQLVFDLALSQWHDKPGMLYL